MPALVADSRALSRHSLPRSPGLRLLNEASLEPEPVARPTPPRNKRRRPQTPASHVWWDRKGRGAESGTTCPMEPVEFPPVRNGLDYMASVVQHLSGTPGPRDLKYAIIHLAAAVEVLTKARLNFEHWALVFADVSKADKAALASGDFRSVAPEDALDRLTKIVGIEISAEDRKRLRLVREKRNRLQHHGLTDTPEAIQAVAAEALDFLLTFVGKHLKGSADDGDDEAIELLLASVREQLGAIESLVDARLSSLEAQLDEIETVLACPMCNVEALTLDDRVNCLFCLWEDDAESASRAYVNSILGISAYEIAHDGGEWPIYECPNCGRETFVYGVVVRGDVSDAHPSSAPQAWCCFADAISYSDREIDSCMRCGNSHRHVNWVRPRVLELHAVVFRD